MLVLTASDGSRGGPLWHLVDFFFPKRFYINIRSHWKMVQHHYSLAALTLIIQGHTTSILNVNMVGSGSEVFSPVQAKQA